MRIPVLLSVLLFLAAPLAAPSGGAAPEWVQLPETPIYLSSGDSGETADAPECADTENPLTTQRPAADQADAPTPMSSPAHDCVAVFTFPAPADLLLQQDPRLEMQLVCSQPTLAVGIPGRLTALSVTLTIEGNDPSTVDVQDLVSCGPTPLTMALTFPNPLGAAGGLVPEGKDVSVSFQANWLSLVSPAPVASVVTKDGASHLSGFQLDVPAVKAVHVGAADGAGGRLPAPDAVFVGDTVYFRVDTYGIDLDDLQLDSGDPGLATETEAPTSPTPPIVALDGDIASFVTETAGFHRFTVEIDHTDPLTNDPLTLRVERVYLVLVDESPDILDPPDELADTDAGPTGLSDGIPDDLDNCPTVYNPGQLDFDRDGVGDACDIDLDGDNVEDTIYTDAAGTHGRQLDNCLRLPNPLQGDIDADGLGDACDVDEDGDAIVDKVLVDGHYVPLSLGQGGDNCPSAANVAQADMDGDLVGDACDEDADGDGTPDNIDVCPGMANLDQSDLDDDGMGDVCDGDMDGDKVPDAIDICPRRFDPQQWDRDGDGIGDECDPDVDGDGRIDNLEADVDQGPPAKRESLFGLTDDREVPGLGLGMLLLVITGLVSRRVRI